MVAGWSGAAKHQASLPLLGTLMNLPKIDTSTLPDLDTLTGVFGSLAHPAQALVFDDSVVIVMVFLYDILNP